jgi:uncharacterized membrane protein
METLVGYILLGGVLLSVTLIVFGLVWRWFRTGQVGFDFSIARMNLFEFVVSDLNQVASAEFRPRLFLDLGIAALLLTPYVRVLASMLHFALSERDVKYTAFTAFVLAVLTFTLFLH